jgi:hypothetical protein
MTQINSKVIEKIKKLLALSQSPNEHGAALAAEKVSVLLAQYNLSYSDIDGEEDIDAIEVVLEAGKSFSSWKKILLSGIARSNGCYLLVRTTTDKKELILIGVDLNIIVCQQLFEYLTQTIERLCQDHKGKGKLFLGQFRLGCAARLGEKLYKQRQEMEQGGITSTSESVSVSALAVQSMYKNYDQKNDQYIKQSGMKTSNRSIATKVSGDGFNEGYSEGDSINLNKQVGSSKEKKYLN